jgi:hypothetical protein
MQRNASANPTDIENRRRIPAGDATLSSIMKTINILNFGIVFEEEFDYELANVASIKGARYFILITDDYSRYR